MLGSLLRSTSNSSGNTNTTITSPIPSITHIHSHITPTAPDYPLRSPDSEIDIGRTLSKLNVRGVGSRDPKFDSGNSDTKDSNGSLDDEDSSGSNNSSNGDHVTYTDTKDNRVPSDRIEGHNAQSAFPMYRRTPSPLVRLVEGNNNSGSSLLPKTTVKTPRSGAASALLESLWEKNVQGALSYSPMEKKSATFHTILRTKSNSTANLNISNDNHSITTVFPAPMTSSIPSGGGTSSTITAKKFVYQHHPCGTRSSETLINLSHSSLATVKTASLSRVNYSMCPVMDHISDDLKSKLFGAKTFHSPDTDTSTSTSSNTSVGTTPTYTKGNKTLYFGSGLRCMLSAQEDAQSYPFRILILEETDQLALRDNHRLIWDYSFPKSSSIGKISVNELKQYIFGSFIRVRDNNKLDQLNEKFRAIPNSNFAIISRIFYCNNADNSDYGEGTRNKYALSLCIPKFLLPVVPELWLSISKWMNETQKAVGSMLLDIECEREQKQRRGYHGNSDASTATECGSTGNDTGNKGKIRSCNFDFCSGSCPGFAIHNSNIGSNSQMILLNQRYHKELHKIVASVRLSLLSRFRSASEVPRLFLYPKDCVKFIKTWFNDCFKWIEIKDGPKLKFLQTLLAVIILRYKDTIIQNSDNNTRIYVLSSNMAVANKLIFLMAGLLNSNFKCNLALINANNNGSDDSVDSESNCNNNDNTRPNKVTVPIESHRGADGDQSAMNASTCSFRSSSELSSSPASMTPTNTRATPESNSASSSFISLASMSPARSIYHSTSKGWEIPKKSASFSSIVPIYVSPMGTPLDPIAFSAASSFKAASSSLQYLSTSLSSRFEFSLGSGHSFTQRNKKTLSAMQGASVESTESGWERTSMRDSTAPDAVPRSSSNGPLFFKAGNSLAAFPSATSATSKQCPSTPEYDEVLWPGTMDTPPSSRPILNGTPTETSTGSREKLVDQSQAFHVPHSQRSFLEYVDIRRDAQRISQIEVINKAFKEVCSNNPLSVQETEYEIDDHLKTVAPVVDIKLELSEEFKDKLRFDELLPRFTSYVPQLDEFFAVQGLPITSEVNSQIANLMRNELAELAAKSPLDSGIGGHPGSHFRIAKNDRVLKSLIVSLRTREIYEIYMKMDMNTGKTYKKVHQIFNLNGLIAKRDSKLQNCIEFVTDIFQKVKANGGEMSHADGEITRIFQLLLNYK